MAEGAEGGDEELAAGGVVGELWVGGTVWEGSADEGEKGKRGCGVESQAVVSDVWVGSRTDEERDGSGPSEVKGCL